MNKHTDNRSYITYSGVVYCVEVPNHIIFVRRNGKACWCGNCEAMGKKGEERVKKNYDLEVVCQQWFDLLKRLG